MAGATDSPVAAEPAAASIAASTAGTLGCGSSPADECTSAVMIAGSWLAGIVDTLSTSASVDTHSTASVPGASVTSCSGSNRDPRSIGAGAVAALPTGSSGAAVRDVSPGTAYSS